MKNLKSGQVFVLIPSHNRRDILCRTLGAICAQLGPGAARIVVVDAGSSDGTQTAVQEKFPVVELVRGSAEMWWTKTVNHGLSYVAQTAVPGDRVILMNDDIDLDSLAMSHLLESSDIEPRAIIGAVNLIQRPNEKPRVYFCGGHYDLRFARHKVNIAEGLLWHVPTSRFMDTDYLFGRLLVIPWEVFANQHRFDENTFPQYCADEDFTFGAKKRGFKVLIDSTSVVYVNEATTARFSLNLVKAGIRGAYKALTAFNSYYNLKQNWAFSARYAKWPLGFIICRYAIILINENLRRN